MKIHMKIFENHKKGNKCLSSFWFSQHRPDFLSVLCFMGGCGNYSAGHFLIPLSQDWMKIYDARSLWKSAIVVTLAFV